MYIQTKNWNFGSLSKLLQKLYNIYITVWNVDFWIFSVYCRGIDPVDSLSKRVSNIRKYIHVTSHCRLGICTPL